MESLVCPEDLEALQDDIRNAVEIQMEESSFEGRLLTEEKELIPVRMLFHFNYNEQGNLTDYEVLALDRKEELIRLDENQYLSDAMFKMKSVVMVKSYHAGKRTLKYISPNAAMLGMNVEALRQGNKLTEDYIHPDDRDIVIDYIYQAVANGVADYDQTYHMVRDDGKIIWVEGHVTINRISDGEAEVSFLLTDISEQKEMEREIASLAKNDSQIKKQSEDAHKKNADDTHMITDVAGRLQLMAEGVGQNADYYMIAMSCDGKIMTNPVGPADNMGIFYDLFDRPEFRNNINEIVEQAKIQKIPKTLDMEISNIPVHMVLSPLIYNEQVKGFWIVADLKGEQPDELGRVIEAQWHLADSIVKSFYERDQVEEEVKNRKLAELKYKKEKKERKVLQELLNISVTEGEAGLGGMCQRMAMYLSVSYVGIYTENRETGNAERYFVWDQNDEDSRFFDRVEFSVSESKELGTLLEKGKSLCVTNKSGEPFLHEILVGGNVKFAAIKTMVAGVGSRGYIAFGDRVRDNEFDKNEEHFVETAAKLIQELVFRKHNVVKRDIIREGLLETYDHIKDAVFVKNNETGEIIFANKAMDKLFGYSVVGMQAQDIVNDQMEQYRLIQGMRKRFIDNNKVSKWQSYLKELDQIMNVVEIKLNVFTTTDLSLVILKRSKKQ